MSTQTLQQGSLRPTRIPAITVVHPGLQVHSIAAPKTDRRLSFLMSANLYCALAAGAVLVAQASPAIRERIIKTDREIAVVNIADVEPAPRPVVATAPPPMRGLGAENTDAPIPAERPQIGVPETPLALGTHDQGSLIARDPAGSTAPGGKTGPGTTSTTPEVGWGAPVEVSASSVSILHQIQPIYPSLARLAHKEGDVVLIMTINEQGVPTEVKMASGDVVFKNDAIRAAQQWRFTPARLDGQPHSARFHLTLQFRLRG
ncbi:MAG: energy transducer TonB [Holophagaceae bacterium]|nr:energy transducer TonB [Holophagaceae bacterium]